MGTKLMAALSRRAVVTGIGTIGLTLGADLPLLANEVRAPAYIAARQNADGTYSSVVFSADGHSLFNLPLPGRGHDCAYHRPSGACVAFARRPGAFAFAFDISRLNARKKATQNLPTLMISPKADRHFYGHGVFSHNGQLLYSTENDYAGPHGVIGIRDVGNGYTQIGEFKSYGIGPHEIALLSDGKTLVVANGGIATHPDSGRHKLNLATMAPNISYIDSQTGDLLEQYELPSSLHQLSIRHMAVARNDVVAFGCQYEGPKRELPPLIGFHTRGKELQIVAAPDTLQPRLKNYIGSMAVNNSGTLFAASAPRGGVITYWDASRFEFVGQTELIDGSGVAAAPNRSQFMLTSGLGQTGLAGPDELFAAQGNENSGIHWDNHVKRL